MRYESSLVKRGGKTGITVDAKECGDLPGSLEEDAVREKEGSVPFPQNASSKSWRETGRTIRLASSWSLSLEHFKLPTHTERISSLAFAHLSYPLSEVWLDQLP